jgi:hypothetical protein
MKGSAALVRPVGRSTVPSTGLKWGVTLAALPGGVAGQPSLSAQVTWMIRSSPARGVPFASRLDVVIQ